MALRKQRDTGFDPGKLNTLVEPLSIRAEKAVAGGRMPIELPNDNEDGTFTKDDVSKLESTILALCGGGTYHAVVADANGERMAWTFHYSSRIYPERVPPTSNPDISASLPPGSALSGPTSQIKPASSEGSLGTMGLQQTLPFVQVQPPSQQQTTWTSPPAGYFAEERARKLEEDIRRIELEKKEMEARAALERQQTQHAADMAALREELRRLAEPKVRSAESDELAKLRLEMEQQRRQFEHEREKTERERAEERHRQELAALNQKVDQRFEQLFSSMQQNQNRPDPLVEFMKESARLQSEMSRLQGENTKEIARLQAQQIEKLAGLTMNPMQAFELASRGREGAESVMKNVTESYGSVFTLLKNGLETINQFGGGNQSPTQAIIQESIGRAGDMFGNWVQMKRDQFASEARSKIAEAQTAQAAAQVEIVRANSAHTLMGATTPVAHSPVTANVVPAPASTNGRTGPTRLPTPQTTTAAPQSISFRDGLTEEDKFGALFEDVKRLRMGVSGGALSPEQVVDAVLMGIHQCEIRKIEVPVLVLFRDGRFPDLLDALLPQAPREFKEQAFMLFGKKMGMVIEEESDDDEDEGTNGEPRIAATPSA